MNETNEKDVLTTEVAPEVSEVGEEMEREKEYKEFIETLDELNKDYLSEEEESTEIIESAQFAEPVSENADSEVEDKPISVDTEVSNGESECVESEICTKENIETIDSKVVVGEENATDIDNQEKYKEYKFNKVLSKITYDLTDPSLTVEQIKAKISESAQFNFNSYSVLTSKVKQLRKKFKDTVKLCAVLGGVENTTFAKKWEVREAKWNKANEIKSQISISLIKEGKKRVLINEIKGLKRIAGNKVTFKCAIDVAELSDKEVEFVINCILLAKVKCVVIVDYHKVSANRLLSVIKKCNGKCDLDFAGNFDNLKTVNHYAEIGVDSFQMKNAPTFVEIVKNEIE